MQHTTPVVHTQAVERLIQGANPSIEPFALPKPYGYRPYPPLKGNTSPHEIANGVVGRYPDSDCQSYLKAPN
jgi:hypothetical protein